MGGIERKASFSKGQQWRRERGKASSRDKRTIGEETPLKGPLKNLPVADEKGRSGSTGPIPVVPSRVDSRKNEDQSALPDSARNGSTGPLGPVVLPSR